MQAERRAEFERILQRGGSISNENIAQIVYEAVTTSIRRGQILSAARGVGFNLVERQGRLLVEMTRPAIADAVKKHRHIYNLGASPGETKGNYAKGSLPSGEQQRWTSMEPEVAKYLLEFRQFKRGAQVDDEVCPTTSDEIRALNLHPDCLLGARVMNRPGEIEQKKRKREEAAEKAYSASKRRIFRSIANKRLEILHNRLEELGLDLIKGKGGRIPRWYLKNYLESDKCSVEWAIERVKQVRSGAEKILKTQNR